MLPDGAKKVRGNSNAQGSTKAVEARVIQVHVESSCQNLRLIASYIEAGQLELITLILGGKKSYELKIMISAFCLYLESLHRISYPNTST